jgi:predicted nucleic acid-binding protein
VALLVVSDASPLRALHHLGLLTLCRDLYGQVIVPTAVQRELGNATSHCAALEIADYTWFEVKAPTAVPRALGVPPDLDAGETEAIALALELHADLVLMDERKGTSAARQLGLATIGVFGVLLDGKRRGLIEAVIPLVDRLIAELNFFTSPAVRQRLAELAGE